MVKTYGQFRRRINLLLISPFIGLFYDQLCHLALSADDLTIARLYNIRKNGDRHMNKGQMAVIATISWIAGLVILALVFTITDAEPSDFPGWLLLIAWLALSKFIHALLTNRKRK